MKYRPANAPPLATLAMLACLLAACAQPVPVDRTDYIGHWRGDGVLLVILANGQADYERVRDGSRTSIKGPVHSFREGEFRIGLGLLSARFEVQQPPRLQHGRWRMVVDGVALTRVDILPVPPGRDGTQRL